MRMQRYIPLVAAGTFVLGGCSAGEVQSPGQQITESTIDRFNANRDVAQFNLGKISVRILTDGKDGAPIPNVDVDEFKKTITRLIEMPVSLDEYADDPAFSDLKVEDMNEVAELAQQDIGQALDTVNAGIPKEWTIILPSSSDTCISKSGFEATLPDHSNCDETSALGQTLKAVGNNGMIDHDSQVTVIAPDSHEDVASLAPVILNAKHITAEQSVQSTLSHESMHAILSFAGIDTLGPSDSMEESIIQLLELNALDDTTKAGSNHPISWNP